MQAEDKGVRHQRHILLRGTVGSQAYGLATDSSDVDTLGVFALDTKAFHGIELPARRHLTHVSTKPDVTLHEAGKFCRLALACNPSVLELLWLPLELYTEVTAAGRGLLTLRERFLSAPRVADVYTGFCHSQVRKIEALAARPDPQVPTAKMAKLARHFMRLVEQGTELWVTGKLNVKVRCARDTHAFGQRVATEGIDGIYPLMFRLRHTFENSATPLPAEPDRTAIQRWLYDVRDTYYELGE